MPRSSSAPRADALGRPLRALRRLAGRRMLRPPGQRPGTIEVSPGTSAPSITIHAYDQHQHTCRSGCDLAAIREWRRGHGILWVDVTGIGNAEILEQLAAEFGVHRLAMEDIAHLGQRAKVDRYGDCLLIIFYQIHARPEPALEQMSLVLGDNWVLSFQERSGDPFDPVRRRLEDPTTYLRQRGADYLAYALIDAVVDGYFSVVEGIATNLDRMEEQLFSLPASLPHDVRSYKRELIDIRRAVVPLREALAILEGDPLPMIDPGTRIFLRDCKDHVHQVLDQVEMGTDIATDQLATFLNLATQHQGRTTEVLTVIATIFLPLTFIAGVYGMNFDTDSPWNMPELEWRYGYPMIMFFMLAVAVGMLIVFRSKGWLGGRRGR